MGVVDGVADVLKQPQAVIDREPVFVAVLGQRHPVDVLHDEVRQAVFGRAAIEQAGDMGMLECREDLAFGTEAVEDVFGVHTAPNNLERDVLFEGFVVAPGEVDLGHTAAPDGPQHPVAAHALALFFLSLGQGQIFQERSQVLAGRGFEERINLGAGPEGFLDLFEQLRVVGAGLIEEGEAMVSGQVEGLIENRFDLLPAFGADILHRYRGGCFNNTPRGGRGRCTRALHRRKGVARRRDRLYDPFVPFLFLPVRPGAFGRD